MNSDRKAGLNPAEVARLFELVDWDDVTHRLLAYASRRLAQRNQLRQVGRTPDDYVQEAVSLALEGRRTVPEEAGQAPVEFFSAMIDSLIGHDAEKAARRPQISIDEVEVVSPEADVEQSFAAREEAEQFLSKLGDELQTYVRLRLSGDYSTAEEYAKALGTTVSHVRNLERRLGRQIVKLPRLPAKHQ